MLVREAMKQLGPAVRRRAWSRLGALLHEGISHFMMLGVILASDLIFSGALIVLVADLILLIFLSMLVQRDQTFWTYAWGFVLSCLLLGVLAGFCLLAYGVAISGQSFELSAAGLARLFDFEVAALRWVLVVSALHLGLMLIFSRFQREPRRAWERLTLLNGGVTFLMLPFLIFVVAFLGEPVIALASALGADVRPDTVLIGLMLALRLLIALMVVMAPDELWEHASRTAPRSVESRP